ncbi:MAG: TolC family protein [Candidatus Latescibacterota bacterium]
MKRKYLLFLFACLALTGKTAFGEVWTLDRAVSAAVAASNSAAVNRLDANGASIDASSAKMNWYPTLSLTGSAGYVNKVMEINLPGNTIQFGGNDSYDFKVRLNQLLYDGGRLNALREAGTYRSEMNLHQAEASELAAEFQAKAAFFSIAASQENVKAAEQSILEAKNHLSDVTALRGQGMALEDDVIATRLLISQAEMSLVTQQANLERARSTFRKVMGLRPDEEITIGLSDKDSADIDSASADEAFKNRPEFKAYTASLAASEKTARSVRADLYPSIGFSGSYSYGKPGLNTPENKWMTYLSGGVSMNWTFWDWGRVNREVEKAEITSQKTIKNRDDLKLTVAQQVSDALTAYREAKERARLASESADFSKRHLDTVTKSFKQGTTTENDYDTAHTLYTRSLYDSAASGFAVQISAAQVEYVLGIRYTGGKHD